MIRATADNPLVDIDAPRRLLEMLDAGADYCRRRRPAGRAAVEGDADRARCARRPHRHRAPTTASTSRRSCAISARSFDVRQVKAPPALYRPHLRLTVDTRADLEFVRSLAEQAGADERLVPLREVIALADRTAGWVGVA